MYNTEKVKPAPTSWKAMWDPKYAGHVAIPGMNTTWGLHTLLMASKIEGGSETNVKAGLEGLKKLQRDSQAVVYTSTTQLNTLTQQGQVWLAPFSSVWVNQLENGGTPVAIAVPQEGVYPIFTVWSVVKGAKNRAAALAFVNDALKKDVQEKFAPRALLMPTNATATLSPDPGQARELRAAAPPRHRGRREESAGLGRGMEPGAAGKMTSEGGSAPLPIPPPEKRIAPAKPALEARSSPARFVDGFLDDRTGPGLGWPQVRLMPRGG
jgi:spermidine/putrescine-binding protein